jgi:hypothetical protein
LPSLEHLARGERVRHRSTHSGVLGRVLVQEVRLELRVLRLRHDGGESPPVVVAQDVVLAESAVREALHGGVVLRDEPALDAAGKLDPVHRSLLTQPRVDGVGIPLEIGSIQGERLP